MRSEALITALMPVHEQHVDFLDASIRSLQEQTSPAWQAILIVEPGQHDAFVSVLREQLRDTRIRLVTNDGRGLAGAFNTGMRAAETDYVAILCADDMWERDAVRVLEREIRMHPEVDFFHSSRRIVDDRGASISSIHHAREHVTLTEFETMAPVKHLLCWRRTMGLAVGGMDESLTVGPDDFDFPWLMAEHGATFGAIDECLYIYRDHRARPRITTHLPRSAHVAQLARVFRKHGLTKSQTKRRLRKAKRSYLRQCLYRSRLERLVKEKLGRSAERGWRATYH